MIFIYLLVIRRVASSSVASVLRGPPRRGGLTAVASCWRAGVIKRWPPLARSFVRCAGEGVLPPPVARAGRGTRDARAERARE